MSKPYVLFAAGVLFFFGVAVGGVTFAADEVICDDDENICILPKSNNVPVVPPLIQKMIQARTMLAREKLAKKIVAISVRQKEKKSLQDPKDKKNKKKHAPDKKMYRIAGAEFLLAVDAGAKPDGSPEHSVAKQPNVLEDEIKIIRLWETLPQAHQHGFTFEVLSPEDCDVEYTGGDGINRRFQTTCKGFDEPLAILGRAMVTMRGKNLFFSREEIEKNTRVVIYSPFADAYVTPEHVAYGNYILREEIINAAYRRLDELGVLSHAYPGELVTNVIPKVFMYITAVNEHGDHGEFDAWGPDFIRKKILTTIAQNQLGVYPACNSSGACGIVQATNKNNSGTYRFIVRMYPEAHLNPKFPEGAYDPVNAMMFAALLYDHELAQLPYWVRAAYTKDPRSVMLCVAAAYHSGGGVAAQFCGGKIKYIFLDDFVCSNPKGSFFRRHQQLWYYLRKSVALEYLLQNEK